ncbi:hypothetical protein Bbelb_143490 [Branchiostoma belcheri]|nr:hypothetical protein Bbelb_143490 [Branchiostoma belcheri]
MCTNEPGTYSCTCIDGFITEPSGKMCMDVDECALNPNICQNGQCENTRGSFACLCDPGYSVKKEGEGCTDDDECQLGLAQCDIHADCSNTDGSYICICRKGYIGDGVICNDLDECQEGTSTCDPNGNCMNIPGSYTCECKYGFQGDGFFCREKSEYQKHHRLRLYQRNRQGTTQMAGNRNTRASTRSKTTKWWNVPASKLPADETLHTDYDDCAKTNPCDTKFATTTDRIPIWIDVCKMRYNEEYGKQNGQIVEWKQTNSAEVLAISERNTTNGKDEDVCVLSIHFWKNGTIMIQGTSFLWWSEKIFPDLKKKVDETLKRSRQNGDPSQDDAAGNEATNTGSSSTAIPQGLDQGKQYTEHDAVSMTSNNSEETPIKLPVRTPQNKSRFRKVVQNLISPFSRSQTELTPNTDKTPGVEVHNSPFTEHISKDIQEHYTDLVDLVNTLQTDMNTLKKEQTQQKCDFEKELKVLTSYSRTLKSQLDEEKKKQYNERKNAESQHNEEMATLTARCESLQSLAETQQQQIAELQREVSSLNISLALAKARSSTESLPCDNHPGTVQDSNSGNNSNKTVTTDTTEVNADTQYANDKTEKVETHPDVEGTQPVRRHEEQPAQVEDSREIRIYTDSIWKAVNTARMFPRRSTSKVKASTISNATQQLKQVNDPGTVYAIFHVGSNDLDNSQHEDSSVEDCLKNTEELVSHAKASFPNATIVLSQVLPRGHDLHSNLNKNIKNYNQSVLQLTRDDDKIIYVRHKKLSTSRHLYKHDGIHLDDVTGTSLLVADVKQTLRTADAKQPPSTAEGTSRDNNQRPQEQARQGQRQTTQARPQDTYQPQYRAQDKAQRTRREEHRYRPEDWRRRPSGYQPQPQMPEQKIINLAYKLSELLSNF